MSPIRPSRKLEIGCDLAVALAVILAGWEMATLLHALGIPLPKGEHRIDLVEEIDTMALILNLILPLGIVALAISTGIRIRCRTLCPLSLVLSLSALVGMFECAIGVYGLFVTVHRPINLWSRIWWMFTS